MVTLTEAGRLFLKEARRTLEQAQHAAVVARRAGRGEIGRIEIGYSADTSYSGVLSGSCGSTSDGFPTSNSGSTNSIRAHRSHSSWKVVSISGS